MILLPGAAVVSHIVAEKVTLPPATLTLVTILEGHQGVVLLSAHVVSELGSGLLVVLPPLFTGLSILKSHGIDNLLFFSGAEDHIRATIIHLLFLIRAGGSSRLVPLSGGPVILSREGLSLFEVGSPALLPVATSRGSLPVIVSHSELGVVLFGIVEGAAHEEHVSLALFSLLLWGHLKLSAHGSPSFLAGGLFSEGVLESLLLVHV